MKIERLYLLIGIGLASAIWGTGCTHHMKVPKTAFTGFTSAERIDLKVGVKLTDDVRRAEWRRDYMGDTFLFQPGTWLCTNMLGLARVVFRDVEEVGAHGPASSGLDAILTPKVTYLNRVIPATSFGHSISTIKVEYVLAEPQGTPIWVETVSGEVEGSPSPKNPASFHKALKEMLAKSQRSMLEADTIRAYATKCRASRTRL